MKKSGTFKIASLFEGEDYITIFDANTCEPIKTLYKGKESKPAEPTYYKLFSWHYDRQEYKFLQDVTPDKFKQAVSDWKRILKRGGREVRFEPQFGLMVEVVEESETKGQLNLF